MLTRAAIVSAITPPTSALSLIHISLVIASICALVFGLGTFAGTVAIVIFTFGVVTKMLYESIETINMGPFEALESACLLYTPFGFFLGFFNQLVHALPMFGKALFGANPFRAIIRIGIGICPSTLTGTIELLHLLQKPIVAI